MAERSAAQKRATAKMIAANRAARRGGSIRRSSRGAAGGAPRKPPRVDSYGLLTGGGLLVAAAGATIQSYDNGDGPINQAKMGNYVQALKDASPTNWALSGSPGNGLSTGKKATVYLGLGAAAAGVALKTFAPGLARRGIKLGRHIRLRLA